MLRKCRGYGMEGRISPLREFNMGTCPLKAFLRPVVQVRFHREGNAEGRSSCQPRVFSRKALSFYGELLLKATDFSPGGGRRPDCPPANQGP